MKMIILLTLLGLCASTLGQTISEDPTSYHHSLHHTEEKHVVELDDKNFCPNVIDKAFSLIMFYDPMCKNCPHEMFDEFEKAADELKDVKFGKVNCFTSGAATCYKMKIKYYPHFMVFRYGLTPLEYLGPRRKDSLVKFMKAVKKVPFGKEWILDEARFPAKAVKLLGLKKSTVSHIGASNPCNSKHPAPKPISAN